MKKAKWFLDQSLKNLMTVGTITRSSSFLCKEIVRQIEFTPGQILLELGAGDGVITRYLLDKMAPDARLIAFEVNPVFCEELKRLDDPRLIIVDQDAARMHEILGALNISTVDHVISAIPFVIFPELVALHIIQAAFEHMVPSGKFVQVHYSLLAKKLYEKIFGSVRIRFVPLNIPPAFLLIMQKAVVPAPVKALVQ